MGLKGRYTLALVALTLSIVVLLGGALLYQFQTTNEDMRRSSATVARAALMSQLEKYARDMATYLAENLANPMYEVDVNSIEELVGSAAVQKGVNFAFVFDANRHVLHDGSVGMQNYGRVLDDGVTRQAVETGKVTTKIGESALEVVAPIVLGSQLLGGVKISYSLETVQGDIADLQGTLAAISAEGTTYYLLNGLIVCASLILLLPMLSIRVADGLTRPIKVLSGLTRQIAEGRYDIEIPFDRSDEIGELAVSLKRMAGELEATTVSKDYLDDILGNMLDPLLVFDRDGAVRSANAAACRTFQASLTELTGRHVSDFMSEDEHQDAMYGFYHVTRDGGPISLEGQLKKPDGSGALALISWSAIADSQENVGHILCVARDISDRKRTEEALRESEERFRALVANSPSAIFLSDQKGRFALVNPRFEEWYGVSAAAAIGKTAPDLFSGDLAAVLMRQNLALPAGADDADREFDVPFADGSVHSVIVTNFPVLGTDGAVMGTGTLHTDVTEQRKIEDRLKQAQKMEAIGQLTGGIAHDFNNLLGVIIGNTELLQEEIGSRSEGAETVIRAAMRGAELTQRMLAFSRRQPLRPQPIDVKSLVEEMQGMLSRTLGETIEFGLSSGTDLWHVMADRVQVESSLLNLAINACHAMPDGGRLSIELDNATLDEDYVATQTELKAGDYVRLSVSDTGLGMTPEIVQHVFEPFFTTKDVGEGSGLGLSMVFGFAKQSGGHVTIYSEPGQGTSVSLYLPRAETVSKVVESPTREAHPRGQNESVLVIEDDPDVRKLSIRMLTGLGYQVTAVQHVAAAKDVLATDQVIDLVLSDVVLPGGVSGPEYAEEISATRSDLKFVFMSGYSAEAAKQNGLLNSDKIFLSKPFQTRQLASALRAALD